VAYSDEARNHLSLIEASFRGCGACQLRSATDAARRSNRGSSTPGSLNVAYGALFTKTVLLATPGGVVANACPPSSKKGGAFVEDRSGLTIAAAL
jgi:hypothetical protein